MIQHLAKHETGIGVERVTGLERFEVEKRLERGGEDRNGESSGDQRLAYPRIGAPYGEGRIREGERRRSGDSGEKSVEGKRREEKTAGGITPKAEEGRHCTLGRRGRGG